MAIRKDGRKGPRAILPRLSPPLQTVVTCLASSIREAGRAAPGAWGLTALPGGRLRLNVGMVEMFVFDPGGRHLIVGQSRYMPPAPRLRRMAAEVEPASYRNLPGAVHVWAPERGFKTTYGLLHDAHLAAITRAARFKGYIWRRSHSAHALRAVAAATGIDLPDPLYAKRHQRAFLLTWNPDSEDFSWPGFAQNGWTGTWRCWNRSPITGDRLYWLRQGGRASTRGLFASGWATSSVRNDHQVAYRIEHTIYPALPNRVLPLLRLQAVAPGVHWPSERSGIAIGEDDAEAIESLWQGFVQDTDEEVSLDAKTAQEGELRYRMAAHRVRERSFRDLKIRDVLRRKGRLRCEVKGCGFDFHQAYGDLGRGFAVVHHLEQLATRKGASRTRLADLAIVCANCHAMIHLGQQNRKLESLGARRGGALAARSRRTGERLATGSSGFGSAAK